MLITTVQDTFVDKPAVLFMHLWTLFWERAHRLPRCPLVWAVHQWLGCPTVPQEWSQGKSVAAQDVDITHNFITRSEQKNLDTLLNHGRPRCKMSSYPGPRELGSDGLGSGFVCWCCCWRSLRWLLLLFLKMLKQAVWGHRFSATLFCVNI